MKFSRRHIVNTLTLALTQGTSPRKLAVTCALGGIIGIFPVWGTTTWICLILSLVFKMNVVIIQLVNYLFFPLQLLLIIPFIKAGICIFGLDTFPYTLDQLIQLFRADFGMAMIQCGTALASGIAVWAALAIPLFFIIFSLSYLIFRKWNTTAN